VTGAPATLVCPSQGAATLLHASCVAWGESGVLLRGPSGSGKSDLALRLIEAGAILVGDDQIALARDGEAVAARPAATLAGLIEARGLGILELPYQASCRLALVVLLKPASLIERLPAPHRVELQGVELPAIALDPTTASATARIRFTLEAVRRH
jgi:HPr kinase/phosphorylase